MPPGTHKNEENADPNDSTGALMTAGLESTRQSKMGPITPSWKLTVSDRRLMWLQKCHPGAARYKLQLWAFGVRR
jgi:hypothetical protein